MTRPRSITRDLILRLLLVFLLSPLIAIPVLLLIDDETPDLRIEPGMEAQADLVIALLTDGPEGTIVLPEAAMKAKPSVARTRFAIYNGASSVPVVRWPADLYLHNWDYHESYDTYRPSRFGPLRILFVSPEKGSAAVASWLEEELFAEILPILAIMLAATLPLTIFSVRRSLAPMRRVATEAAAIDPGMGNAKLTEAGAPLELLPLIRAINRGLERIDIVFAAQKRFSALVAHELRSPLAALSVSLEHETLNGQGDQILKKLRGMSKLIDQLLILSELSSRRLKLDSQVDLKRVVSEAVAEETLAAVNNNVSLAVNLPDSRVQLRGNAAAIGTALRNLIENAVRHSPKGSTVTVTAGHDGPWLEVADTGAGIPADQRDSVFTPFWRSAESAGAGLGLAIVRQMAELHHARVSIRDNLPKGTIFRIAFGTR
jgi:signal transduction histidine kinase